MIDQLPCYGTVAIKMLDDSARDDPEELTLLLEVASLMAKMRHPNIVRVYGLVVDDKDVVAGMLIEYFHSGPLSLVLKEQVRVGVSPQTSVPAGLRCRHHLCCGGLMQLLCAGPALMTSRQRCACHLTPLPSLLSCVPPHLLCCSHAPPWKELLHVARDISAGMGYLHNRTGRHCKLEPDNIFVKDCNGQMHAAVGEPFISLNPNTQLDPAVGVGADRQAMGLPVLTCLRSPLSHQCPGRPFRC